MLLSIYNVSSNISSAKSEPNAVNKYCFLFWPHDKGNKIDSHFGILYKWIYLQNHFTDKIGYNMFVSPISFL